MTKTPSSFSWATRRDPSHRHPCDDGLDRAGLCLRASAHAAEAVLHILMVGSHDSQKPDDKPDLFQFADALVDDLMALSDEEL